MAGNAMALDFATGLAGMAVCVRDAHRGHGLNCKHVMAIGRVCGLLFSWRPGDWAWPRVEIRDDWAAGGFGILPGTGREPENRVSARSSIPAGKRTKRFYQHGACRV